MQVVGSHSMGAEGIGVFRHDAYTNSRRRCIHPSNNDCNGKQSGYDVKRFDAGMV